MATNKNKIPKDAFVIIGQYLLQNNQNHFVSLKKKDGWEAWEVETDALYNGLPPAIWCADAVRIDIVNDNEFWPLPKPDKVCDGIDVYAVDMPI